MKNYRMKGLLPLLLQLSVFIIVEYLIMTYDISIFGQIPALSAYYGIISEFTFVVLYSIAYKSIKLLYINLGISVLLLAYVSFLLWL